MFYNNVGVFQELLKRNHTKSTFLSQESEKKCNRGGKMQNRICKAP